ncbi:MAG: M6 family metalloprotease domain-containing protein, partial [Chloroflexi bacterium]
MNTSLLRIVLAAFILVALLLAYSPVPASVDGGPAPAAVLADADPVAQAARRAIAQAYPQGLEKAVADARLSQAGGERSHSMPPHPDMLDKIKRGEAKLPSFTDQVPNFAPGLGKGPSLAPLTGTIRVLVILVDFSDKTRTVTANYFDSLMFAAPVAGRGSVRDYFNDVSYGTVDIVTANMPSSIGWVRAPSTRATYVNNNYCTDGPYPTNCRKLAEDLIDAVNPFVDFSLYDNNNDGYTEPVMIVHSGQGAEFTGLSSDIWSHAWWLYNFRTYDGKTIRQYTIQPEYWSSVNSATSDMTIGVFAHEMGHGFWSLPDLYDTDLSSEGLGNWSLMAGGSWNGLYGLGDSPAWPDAWSRIQMGIATPTEVVTNTTGLSLPQTYGNGAVPTVFKLGSTIMGAQEYFLLENREKTPNTYDQYLPGQGLLIWHVDGSKTSNTTECRLQPHSLCGSTHYLVALEQADGLRHLEYHTNRGDANDVFPTATNNTWNRTSNPESSSWYTSSDTFISTPSIGAAGATMTANVTTGLVTPSALNATIPIAGQASLTWTDGSQDETNFRVERSTDGGAFEQIGTAAKNATSYTNSPITCGHSYTYRVRAYRSIFNGQFTPYSNTATVDPGACAGSFSKTAPSNGATGQAINGLALTWGTSTGATSYAYCFDTTNDSTCNTSWTNTGATTATLTGLAAGTTYYWQVSASGGGNTIEANGGAWWSFTTLPPPGAFVKSSPSNGSNGRAINNLVLSWGPS